jgi:hypothetical protein
MYSKTSPYYDTILNGTFLELLTLRDLPLQADDILFTVTQQYSNRPDLLAYDLYNDVNLWWVFAVRNKDIIKDPVFDMIPGQRIYLPKLSTINAVLGI